MHGDHKFSDLVEAIYDAGLQPVAKPMALPLRI